MAALALCEMTFTEKIVELRELTGITNEELAEITGISINTIKTYFKGTREPSFSNAAKIAKAYGKSLEHFADADEVTDVKPKKKRK